MESTFDAATATAQYIDGLGAASLEKAAAYTTGNHWLLLWGLAISTLTTWVFIKTGILDRLGLKLQKRRKILRTFLIVSVYSLLSSILTLPWTLYSSWWRELGYGRTSQSLGDFLGQNALQTLIAALTTAVFFLGIYALINRAGKRWWILSGGLAAITISALLLLGPIVIEPLFNEYKPIPEGEVRTAVLEMAKKANIHEDRIFVYDGSRQSNNFTANVSGIGSSARIAISDVALKNASLDEVKAVTGHEIGHYVNGDIWQIVGLFSLLAILFFYLADRSFPGFAAAFGTPVKIGDPEGIPILLLIVSILGTLATPMTNTLTRIGETQADNYSLQTVNLPDALAQALVKTAEYRNPRPNRAEEFLFYTHPSVERRVMAAMEWKEKHPN